MSKLFGSTYRLNLTEIYPHQDLFGFQLAPNGQYLSLIYQRDQQVEEMQAENGQRKIKITPLSDLYLLPCEGGFPRQLTDSGDVYHFATWSPDAQHLAFDNGVALQTITADGKKCQTVYRGHLYYPPLELGDNDLCAPSWSPDSKFILFAIRNAPTTKLLLVSADGCLIRELFSIDGDIIGWNWSPDGRKILLVTRYENGWVGDIRILDIDSGDIQILWEETNYEYCKPVARWHPNGEFFVFRSNRSGWAKLWVATAEGKNLYQLTFGDCDDYAFCFSASGERLIYASRADQKGSGDDLWLIPFKGEQAIRLTYHPGVNIPLTCAKDNRIFYWHTSPTEIGDLWSFSDFNGRALQLTWSTPLTLAHKLAPPEEILISNKADNHQVPALVYRPVDFSTDKHYPAIIWVRGGPTSMCRYTYTPFLNWLANQGYIVITPDYRGSVGYGTDYMSAVAGPGLGKADLSDVLATGQYARTLPEVDLARGVGVGGRSWGGYLTLMAITQAPEIFSCAVAGSAIADWAIQQSQTEVRYYDRWLVGGWIYEQEAHAKERSPINFVERINAPLLIYHGEEDCDVPFAQMGPFVEKAREAGKDIEYITYPAEGHGNQKPENQQDVLNRIGSFFRRHLQPWNYRDNPCANQVQQ